MKKVIFVCLLSLSLCLGKPADEQVKPLQQQNAPAVDPNIQTPIETPQAQKPTTTEQKVMPKTESAIHTEETIKSNKTKVNPPQPNADENKTKKETEPPKEEAKKVDPPKEEAKKVEPSKEEKKIEPSKDTQSTTGEKTNADNKETGNTTTKPEEKTEKGNVTPTTTEKANVTPKPSEAPKKEDDKPVLQARGFDGPSFVGGIILTLGLLAISFMGFKYYKNQTERNYHTL